MITKIMQVQISTVIKLDFEKAEKEILAAYSAGVNYFDTAYIYPGSEALLGEVLEKNNIPLKDLYKLV